MDVQIKRGLLEVCVLAALNHGDSYGYRIIKDIEPYISISESTLYPILRRLEEGKHLTVYSIAHNGRLRKYYQITDNGRLRLKDFAKEWEEILNVYKFIIGEVEIND